MQGINPNVNAQIKELFPKEEIKHYEGFVKVWQSEVNSVTIDDLSRLQNSHKYVEIIMKRSGVSIAIIFTDLSK
jgi:hypothetical protein